MKRIVAVLILAFVVVTACNDAEKPEVEPPVAPDQLNAIIQRIEALETVAAAPSPEPIRTATETPLLTPAPTETAPSTPAPTATLSPTPIPVGRQDICYRALPVQEALLGKFSNVNLCAAVQVRELFRITELQSNERIEAQGHLLKRTDFTDLPNLKQLDVETDLEGLAPDVFHSLSGLEYLHLTFHIPYSIRKTLPADLLNGLPSGLLGLELRLEPSSEWTENQAIELPSDLFASVPHLTLLEIYLDSNDRGPYLEFDSQSLSGLIILKSLSLQGPLSAIPREMFADLVSLDKFELGNTVNDTPHILYFPTRLMMLKFEEHCKSRFSNCVIGETIEQ